MKIVFCLPGKTCTATHRNSWINAIPEFHKRNIDIDFRDYYSSDIYNCRNYIVRGSYKEDFNSDKPFGGMHYDFMMWIDSDVAFNAEDILKLIENDVDIVCGAVPIAYGIDIAGFWKNHKDINGNIDTTYRYPLSKIDNIPLNDKGLLEIDFTGFGFICVKRGVFESIGYPYFKTRTCNHIYGETHALSEDLGWCMSAKECEYKIFTDPSVKVLHDTAPSLFKTAKG